VNVIREKNFGRRIRACVETGCRVTTYIAVVDGDCCPGCGSDGLPLNELAHRQIVGTTR
jgi:hypothetical protein